MKKLITFLMLAAASGLSAVTPAEFENARQTYQKQMTKLFLHSSKLAGMPELTPAQQKILDEAMKQHSLRVENLQRTPADQQKWCQLFASGKFSQDCQKLCETKSKEEFLAGLEKFEKKLQKQDLKPDSADLAFEIGKSFILFRRDMTKLAMNQNVDELPMLQFWQKQTEFISETRLRFERIFLDAFLHGANLAGAPELSYEKKKILENAAKDHAFRMVNMVRYCDVLEEWLGALKSAEVNRLQEQLLATKNKADFLRHHQQLADYFRNKFPQFNDPEAKREYRRNLQLFRQELAKIYPASISKDLFPIVE